MGAKPSLNWGASNLRWYKYNVIELDLGHAYKEQVIEEFEDSPQVMKQKLGNLKREIPETEKREGSMWIFEDLIPSVKLKSSERAKPLFLLR